MVNALIQMVLLPLIGLIVLTVGYVLYIGVRASEYVLLIEALLLGLIAASISPEERLGD